MSDFNDQEQVDLIKSWWRKHGTFLVIVLVIMAIAIIGYNQWEKREQTNLTGTSLAYMSLLESASKHDSVAISAKASALIKDAPKSAYAGLGSLLWAADDVRQAKYDDAQTHLQWVIKNQKNSDLIDIAKVRSARLYLQDKKPQQAIALLTPVSAAFMASDQMVLADAYAMQKQYAKASNAYKAAIKAMPKGAPLVEYVTMKLHNLPNSTDSLEGSA